MKDNRVHVVLAADNTFAMPLAVTARSILDNAKMNTNFCIHIMDGGISRRNKRRILDNLTSKRCQVHWIDTHKIESEIASLNLPIRSCFSIVTYFRFMLADVLPEKLSKVIYLDADTIVLKDLSRLWATNLDNAALAAVIDPTIHTIGKAQHLDALALNPELNDLPYFNAGVIIINLALWRNENIGEQLLRIADAHKTHLLFQDQDVLNLVLRERWVPLSPIWNQTPYLLKDDYESLTPYSSEQAEDARTHPCLVHFAANPKPWAKGCTHAYKHTFYAALDNTAWKGWRPNLVGRLRRKLELKLS